MPPSALTVEPQIVAEIVELDALRRIESDMKAMEARQSEERRQDQLRHERAAIQRNAAEEEKAACEAHERQKDRFRQA